MDGNGRWAKSRGLPRFEGHRRGVEAVRRVVRSAIERGVQFLTIYSFSSENWSRPPEEVAMLMGLLKRFIREDLAELNANGVRVRVIGQRDNLTPDIIALIVEAEMLTADNRGLTLTVAFNYGGRQEIFDAARRLAIDRPGRIGRAARHGWPTRPRSHHSHLWGDAALELLALAGGLR
jgi:undecaprenyl diphosphate synthase